MNPLNMIKGMMGNMNPKNIVMNIAKQKGITEQQLKEMAKQIGIKI